MSALRLRLLRHLMGAPPSKPLPAATRTRTLPFPGRPDTPRNALVISIIFLMISICSMCYTQKFITRCAHPERTSFWTIFRCGDAAKQWATLLRTFFEHPQKIMKIHKDRYFFIKDDMLFSTKRTKSILSLRTHYAHKKII